MWILENNRELTFSPASLADADALLLRGARTADWRECFKANGSGLGGPLRFSVAASAMAVAVHFKRRIIALFGVGEDAAGHGAVWLAAHAEAERPDLAVALARASRRFVDCWQREFKRLHNVADPEHAQSLRWLTWLGFTIDRDNPVRGPLGHELYRFWRE